MKLNQLRWRPLSEYVDKINVWKSPNIVLLGGMRTNANSTGECVRWYSLGYWNDEKKKWIDYKTGKPYNDSPLYHPQYFALVCNDIEHPKSRDDLYWDRFNEKKWKQRINSIKIVPWQFSFFTSEEWEKKLIKKYWELCELIENVYLSGPEGENKLFFASGKMKNHDTLINGFGKDYYEALEDALSKVKACEEKKGE